MEVRKSNIVQLIQDQRTYTTVIGLSGILSYLNKNGILAPSSDPDITVFIIYNLYTLHNVEQKNYGDQVLCLNSSQATPHRKRTGNFTREMIEVNGYLAVLSCDTVYNAVQCSSDFSI